MSTSIKEEPAPDAVASSSTSLAYQVTDNAAKQEDVEDDKSVISVMDDDDEDQPHPSLSITNGISAAQQRYNEDMASHTYEQSKPERVADDWQVAYVWAFIVKFELKGKIRRLECLEDFERCLLEPIANRPDDVLEGVLVQFMKNLKPTLRNIDCTNVQTHVSNYVTDQLLNSTEFTVWDRTWGTNEETRSACCNDSEYRLELGRLRGPDEEKSTRAKRNPLLRMEQHGEGLFELDWHERALLLRQMVDWQLTHSDVIRNLIKAAQPPARRKAPQTEEEAEEIKKRDDMWRVEPVGLDRNKNRIWSFDDTPRLYQSGNPFKRPCPITAISTTRDELRVVGERYADHGARKPPKPKGTGAKGKPTPKEGVAHRKLLTGIENERKLSEFVINDLMPKAEKEELRVQRARRKIAENVRIMQAAELRSTRTRRSAKKIDYTYDSIDEDDEPRRGRGAATATYEPSRARPVIPGERRSARVRANVEDSYDEDGVDTSAAPSPSPSPPVSGVSERAAEVFPEGAKKVKGYAWIETPTANGIDAASGGHSDAMEVDE